MTAQLFAAPAVTDCALPQFSKTLPKLFDPRIRPYYLPDRAWRRALLKALALLNDFPSYQHIAKGKMLADVDRSFPGRNDMSRKLHPVSAGLGVCLLALGWP
jgi:hypothetical protein